VKKWNLFKPLFWGMLGLSYIIAGAAISAAEPTQAIEESTVSNSKIEGDDQSKNEKILVELFLPAERKKDIDVIKKELEAISIKRIRPQFFKLGNPIENIAIGKDIPAPVARLLIQLALTYNRGIKYILPEFRYFPNHIVIGSSAYDEASQIPITPEDLKRLSDPALSTPEFHGLYRSLTGEDKKLPTYID
jgi:hypothetical protein